MICLECRSGTHYYCEGTGYGILPRTCDCQHQPGTVLSTEGQQVRDTSLGRDNEDSAAPVHVTRR